MDTILKLADLFMPLPHEQQKEILDFAEFIFLRYSNSLAKKNKSIEEKIPSEELILLLKERLELHKQNPEKSKNWSELQKELLAKY